MDQAQLGVLLQIVPWIFPAFTVSMTYVVYLKHRRWVDAPKIQVEAEIVRYEMERDADDSSTSYYPVYRFRTALGQTIEAREMMPGNDRPAIGSRLPVFYDSENPGQVSRKETGMPWWGWLILALANAAFFAFAGFVSVSL